jgi:OOP family OmpA-OmpF porin
MKKTFFTLVAMACMVSLWTIASVQAFEIITRDMVEKEVVTKTDLIKTVDNFIVLFNTSGTTNQMVPGKNITKIAATKALLQERNAWFPDLDYQAGLYEYTNNETLTGTFKAIYPMQAYDRQRFGAAIDQLPEKGQGPTMLQAGLIGLRKVVDGLSGKTAVIMFTDGTSSVWREFKKPLQIAQEIVKDKDVCFYLISSATEAVNAQLLESVSKVNACSRVIPLTAFMDNPLYLSGALFTVRTSSYVRLKPTTQVVGVVADDMLFDFDSSAIRSEYNQKLDMLGDYLQKNPEAYAVAAGFADSAGDDEYNLWLSKRRATNVKNYLVSTFNIDMNRVVPLWFGELNPVADNATEEGRQRNRRVEIAVGGVN